MMLRSNILACIIPCMMLLAMTGCQHEGSNKSTQSFEVEYFDALSDFAQAKDSIKSIDLDYGDAINSGFIVPSFRQVTGGYFRCKFSIRNNSNQPKRYAYKIYYQNESYKFPEADNDGNPNHYALENFYGSWDDTTIHFKPTPEILPDGQSHVIIDSIRIVGNPRNEELFYENGINKRWKRNPRVGTYSFLLVITEEAGNSQAQIPLWVGNVGLKKDNDYVHPYYYFLHGEGRRLENTLAVHSSTSLKVVARPDMGAGIFANGYFFPKVKISDYATSQCGNDEDLYNNAHFSQFIHYIDLSTKMENIPVVEDVLSDNYSKRDYNWNRSFYRREELIATTPMTASIPCQTVYSDPVNKKIVIHNPATRPGEWKKENVGIISMHGLTYGKFRVKAKLTELLNRNNVWNGITNAIWMINQPGDEWNLRRPCNKEGYMATYWGGPKDQRVERVAYSEIDFEILKSPSYCPGNNFPPVFENPTNNPNDIASWDTPLPQEILKDDGNISVACTNWDMACWEPENFGVGCNSVTYGDKTFEAHRWDHWYRATTEKTQASDDSLFASPYYYFEIDWKPTEIIWRIGPEPDRLRVVGYMNDKMTSIPNNQMLLIVTQEFHNTKWWPGAPYQQKFIPFPSKDIVGEIYEVVME